MRKEWTLRLIEVMFHHLLVSLFKQYPDPVKVYRFLESCCTLFDQDRIEFEQLLVKEMQADYNNTRLLNELLYLQKQAGVSESRLMEISGLNRSTLNWRLNQFKHNGIVYPIRHTQEELEIMRKFIQKYTTLGRIL